MMIKTIQKKTVEEDDEEDEEEDDEEEENELETQHLIEDEEENDEEEEKDKEIEIKINKTPQKVKEKEKAKKAENPKQQVIKKEEKKIETKKTPKVEEPATKKRKAEPETSEKPATTTITKLPTGLQFQDVRIGTGKPIREGQKVSIRYKGLLQDGQVFDTNLPKGRPLVFKFGSTEVIQGFNVGMNGMKPGGRRNLLIPSHLGYGSKGSPPEIPPNAPLIFEVHLLNAT